MYTTTNTSGGAEPRTGQVGQDTTMLRMRMVDELEFFLSRQMAQVQQMSARVGRMVNPTGKPAVR